MIAIVQKFKQNNNKQNASFTVLYKQKIPAGSGKPAGAAKRFYSFYLRWLMICSILSCALTFVMTV